VTTQRQEPNLGVLLFVAYRELEQRAHDALVAADITDITLAQARIAARIGPHDTLLDLREITDRSGENQQALGTCAAWP